MYEYHKALFEHFKLRTVKFTGKKLFMKKTSFLLLLILAAAMPLWSKEFFVSPAGNDAGHGTLKAPFKTIQRGVDALKAGDTLTILPGSYSGSVKWLFDGDPTKQTTLRAQIPGTVLLHGDREVRNFKAVPGKKNCYVLDFAQTPQGVNECDTLLMYARDDTMLESPYPSYGTWTYDAKAKKLYIATSDGKAPEMHALTVSVTPNSGLDIAPAKTKKVRNVVIDGLSFRGFATTAAAAHSSLWGAVIYNGEKCVIRNCNSYLNEGGITMYSADGGRVENCRAYGNGTVKHVSAGNIVLFNCKNSTIDNCLSFNSVTYGIRFYGTNSHNTISRSISIGDKRGSIWIKPDDETNRVFQSYAPGMVAFRKSANCVYNSNDYDRSRKHGPTSLWLGKGHIVTYPEDFADPWNFDLRLQKNSRFKHGFTGSPVYFVSPGGSDANDGASVKSPWKTLKNVPAGATVYLLPGTYPGGLTLTADNVTVAGRGQHGRALIRGGKYALQLKGANTILKRLHFEGQSASAICLEGGKLTLECATFANQKSAVEALKVSQLQITHCTFAPSVKEILKGKKCTGFFTGNIASVKPAGVVSYANVPAEQKMMSPDGRPYGPYFFLYTPEETVFDNVDVIANSATTANLLWTTPTEPVAPRVTVAEKSGRNRKTFPSYSAKSSFHSVSLTGLKGGTEYVYSIQMRPRMRYVLSSKGLQKKFNPDKLPHTNSKPAVFRTPKTDRAPQVWYVSAKGDDRSNGSAKAPFRTISRAAMATAPGDTVIVKGGTYYECVFVPVTGTPAKPITFKAAPGEEVWMDGASRRFCRAFALFGKNNVHFDGFHFKKYGTAFPNASGIFLVLGGGDVRISRCFSDARGPGYSPAFIHARNARNISLKQSVIIGGMSVLVGVETQGMEIVNNVFKKASIWTINFHSGSKENKILFANNILTDNIRGKTFQAPFMLTHAENLVERNNLYFMRFPRNLRKMVEYTSSGKTKQLTLDEYCKLVKSDGGSFFADPQIKVLSTQLCWRNAAERSADLKKGMAFQRNNNNMEDGRNPKNFSEFRHWNFADFFNQELFRKRNIGLDQALFKDMVVKALPGYSKR